MILRRATPVLLLVTVLASSVTLFAAPEGSASGSAPLHLRRAAREWRLDREPAASPWKAVRFQSTPHHRRGLWVAIGAASGAAGGAFFGAVLQSLSESGESLTSSAVVGGALGGLAGGVTAALLTRK